MFDYDNDGDLDLLVVNQASQLDLPGSIIYQDCIAMIQRVAIG